MTLYYQALSIFRVNIIIRTYPLLAGCLNPSFFFFYNTIYVIYYPILPTEFLFIIDVYKMISFYTAISCLYRCHMGIIRYILRVMTTIARMLVYGLQHDMEDESLLFLLFIYISGFSDTGQSLYRIVTVHHLLLTTV